MGHCFVELAAEPLVADVAVLTLYRLRTEGAQLLLLFSGLLRGASHLL